VQSQYYTSIMGACRLETATFNSSYANVTLGSTYTATACGNNAFNFSFDYAMGCAMPSPYQYQPYGVPTKDLLLMVGSNPTVHSGNATFDLCLSQYLDYSFEVLFVNPGNASSSAVQCVPRTLSPTPPTTNAPTPPTTMNPTYVPTPFPTFSPTTTAQNAIAVDFHSVPSPLVFEADPYVLNSQDTFVYGAYQTTLSSCVVSPTQPACLQCDAPIYANITLYGSNVL